MLCGLFSAQRGVQSWALYNTHSSCGRDWQQEMSSISQTKVPLVNVFLGNMIRFNKFPSWMSQNWIFFESPMTKQHFRSSTDLLGQCSILTGHCPLTGRYFKPWEEASNVTSTCLRKFQLISLSGVIFSSVQELNRVSYRASFNHSFRLQVVFDSSSIYLWAFVTYPRTFRFRDRFGRNW